jgi:hypothetical protein
MLESSSLRAFGSLLGSVSKALAGAVERTGVTGNVYPGVIDLREPSKKIAYVVLARIKVAGKDFLPSERRGDGRTVSGVLISMS